MGSLVGGIISGLGSYFGAKAQASAETHAADLASQTALTGYNYLNNNAANQQYQANGAGANSAQAQLLGLSPITDATKNGFQNYLGSTGYNFQLGQGTNAIASQGAASGLLNSGGTGKALEQYGQNIGGQYFNNYLSQLGGVSQAGQAAIFAPANAAGQGEGAGANVMYNGLSNAGQANTNAIGNLASTFSTYAGQQPAPGTQTTGTPLNVNALLRM